MNNVDATRRDASQRNEMPHNAIVSFKHFKQFPCLAVFVEAVGVIVIKHTGIEIIIQSRNDIQVVTLLVEASNCSKCVYLICRKCAK